MLQSIVLFSLLASLTFGLPQDPNQAVLNKFTQFAEQQTSLIPNTVKTATANLSGECAAAIEKEGENLGVWDYNSKICTIQTTIKNKGSQQFRTQTGLRGINVNYSLNGIATRGPLFPDKDKNTVKTLLEKTSGCQIVLQETDSASNQQATFCVALVSVPGTITLVRGVI